MAPRDDLLATRGAESQRGSDSSKESTGTGGSISAPDGVKTPERGWHQHRGERGGGGFPLSRVTTPLGKYP